MSKLVIGCGYLGLRVAKLWRAEDKRVMAVTRTAERAIELATAGLWTIGANVTLPQTLTGLSDLPRLGEHPVSCALFAVGFDRRSGKTIHETYAGGLQNVLDALPDDIERFIYISTTGVYGPAGGDWVDEDTPPDPQREGGKASFKAEQILSAHPLGRRGVILRLAGLYGPGRIPFIDDLRADRPIAASQSGYLNLIHVDDAADVVIAASRIPSFDDGPRIFCVSDGHPVERRAFYEEVARRFNAASPRFTEPDPNSPRALRAAVNRRVRNDKMLAELNVKLAYPNYRAGLAAILETGNQ